MHSFIRDGKVSVLIDGQWGSTGKGLLAAYLASQPDGWVDVAFTNAAPNAGHTSYRGDEKLITFHMPTWPLFSKCWAGLTAGAAIDPPKLFEELAALGVARSFVAIHPQACVIEDQDKAAEALADSGPAMIASTQKGVGTAFARRVLRSARVARDVPELLEFVQRWELLAENLDSAENLRCVMEVPQGRGLSLTSQFYPHVTSRNVNVAQALSDLRVHPARLGRVAMSVRTFPIRVGNLNGNTSGGCYDDQREMEWDEIGVEPETTTVTGRQRRLFSWSNIQYREAVAELRPDVVFLNFANYTDTTGLHLLFDQMGAAHRWLGISPQVLVGHGPRISDVSEAGYV